MAFRDQFQKFLVYFGLAEEHVDGYDAYGAEPEGDDYAPRERTSRSRAVRTLAGGRSACASTPVLESRLASTWT